MHAMYQLFLYFIIYVHFISRYICALRVQTTITYNAGHGDIALSISVTGLWQSYSTLLQWR